MSSTSKTVVVLGAAYGGARAAHLLAQDLPQDWKLIVVDRNSHANHVYILPRLAVLPGHEHKAFVPYTRVFHPPSTNSSAPSSIKPSTSTSYTQSTPKNGQATFLHASLASISTTHITVSSFSSNSSSLISSFGSRSSLDGMVDIPYDYAIYALGSRLPAPVDLWGSVPSPSTSFFSTPNRKGVVQVPYGGTKTEGIEWLKRTQTVIDDAGSVLIVGGGALGIQFATDISAVHPTKPVTLLHSRSRLMPRFDEAMHQEVLLSLESANVSVVLGERLDLSSTDSNEINNHGQRVVRTMSGKELAADLILLCTGQTPNTGILSSMDPCTVDPDTGLAHVLPTLQLGVLPKLSPTGTSPTPADVPASPACDAISGRLAEWKKDSDLKMAKGISTRDEDNEDGDRTPVGAHAGAKKGDAGVDVEELEERLEVVVNLEEESARGHVDIHDALEDPEEEEEVLEEEEDDDEKTPYPHIFVVGDAADAFGALKAGHNAYFQAEVAVRNIIKLIQRDTLLSSSTPRIPSLSSPIDPENEKVSPPELTPLALPQDFALEHYHPSPPAIKVSLGLTRSVYQINGVVGTNNDGVDDLNAAGIWSYFGFKVEDEAEMFQ